MKLKLFVLITLVYFAALLTDFSHTNFTVGLSYVDALDRLRVHLNIILFPITVSCSYIYISQASVAIDHQPSATVVLRAISWQTGVSSLRCQPMKRPSIGRCFCTFTFDLQPASQNFPIPSVTPGHILDYFTYVVHSPRSNA